MAESILDNLICCPSPLTYLIEFPSMIGLEMKGHLLAC